MSDPSPMERAAREITARDIEISELKAELLALRNGPWPIRRNAAPGDVTNIYSVLHLDAGLLGRADPEVGMEFLRRMFPSGDASYLQFALFSTGGIHGTYVTIEEIEESLTKYGDEANFLGDDERPDGWVLPELTVLVVQPRRVCLRCGQVRVRLADVPWLKKLRASSHAAVASIGG